MYMFGGVTAGGLVADMYSLAAGGYDDATALERTNLARQAGVTAFLANRDANMLGDANRAIDGVLTTSANPSFGSVSATENMCTLPSRSGAEHSWLTIDLGSVQRIDAIRLWGRTDCCTSETAGFQLYVNSLASYTSGFDTPCANPFSMLVGTATITTRGGACAQGTRTA